jgi:hypothetical protein
MARAPSLDFSLSQWQWRKLESAPLGAPLKTGQWRSS